jgi:spore coat polysaccharide biosynthesis protein SpsF
MGSRRLPGKVAARLGGATILEHCIVRLRAAGLPLIVATTDRADDDIVDFEARRLGASVFRGSEDDVLGRFVLAAHMYGVSTIIRATADNPFVDPAGPERLLRLLDHVRADHVVERGLPAGAAVELVSLEALERARLLATDSYDREHVTSFIRRDPQFQALRAMAPADLRRPDLRLTVDTEADLESVRAIAAALGPDAKSADLLSVIRAAEMLRVRPVLADRPRIERKGA